MTERDQLLAEKTSLKRMLATLPESSVIDRMSLEARKVQVEEALRGEAIVDADVHEESMSLSGHFLGVLPKRRTFEFQIADTQDIIAGTVAPDIEDAGSINQVLGTPLTIQVHAKRAGTGRPKYTLLHYQPSEKT